MEAMKLVTVPLDKIRVSEFNDGKVDKKSLKYRDLLASVKANGVLIPLCVRKNGDGYVCMAGKNRLAAARESGLKTLQCVEYDVDDTGSADITYLENAHRRILGCLEESTMVDKLMVQHQGDIKEVAAFLGQTVQWVAMRAQIGKGLDPDFKKWAQGKKVKDFDEDASAILSTYSVGHWAEIARMPLPMQQEFYQKISGHNPLLTIAEIQEWVGRQKMTLDGVPFPVNDKLECACTELPSECFTVKKQPNVLLDCGQCKQRTGYEPTLWGESEGALGQCLNPECYKTKLAWAHVARIQAELDKRGDCILIEHGEWDMKRRIKALAPHLEFVDSYDLRKCKMKSKGARYVLYADGKASHYGKLASELRATKKAKEKEKAGPPLTDGQKKKNRMKQVTAKRQIHVNHALCEEIAKAELPVICDSKGAISTALSLLVQLAAIYGTSSKQPYEGYKKYDPNGKPKAWPAELFKQIREPMSRSCKYSGTLKDWTPADWKGTQNLIQLFKLDEKALMDKAIEEHPTPKSCR